MFKTFYDTLDKGAAHCKATDRHSSMRISIHASSCLSLRYMSATLHARDYPATLVGWLFSKTFAMKSAKLPVLCDRFISHSKNQNYPKLRTKIQFVAFKQRASSLRRQSNKCCLSIHRCLFSKSHVRGNCTLWGKFRDTE